MAKVETQAEKEAREEKERKINSDPVFKEFNDGDTNQNNLLSLDEFSQLYKKINTENANASEAEIKKYFKLGDKDGSETLIYEEWKELLEQIKLDAATL